MSCDLEDDLARAAVRRKGLLYGTPPSSPAKGMEGQSRR